MANTLGYLAAIYRGLAVTVGASDVYSLLTNGGFETGDETGWTKTIVTAGTATATASAGYGDKGYGCKIVDDGDGVNISQTITLDSATTAAQRCVFSLWAKLPTTTSATMKLSFLDAADAELSNVTRTITADAGWVYSDAEWAYWSKYADADIGTKKVKIEIYSAAAFTWYVDDVACAFVEQVDGAYVYDMNEEKAVIQTTTFKSAQDDSKARSYILGRESVSVSAQTFREGTETYSLDGSQIFIQLFTDTGTAKDREECWAILHSKSTKHDPEDADKKDFSLQPVTRIGYTKEA